MASTLPTESLVSLMAAISVRWVPMAFAIDGLRLMGSSERPNGEAEAMSG